MRLRCLLLCGILLMLASCGDQTGAVTGDAGPGFTQTPSDTPEPEPTPTPTPYIIRNDEGMTLAERFAPPEGFTRVPVTEGSFAEWLRVLPLKEHGLPVMLGDGTAKPDALFAAVADAPGYSYQMEKTDFMLSLHAGYLYSAQRYEEMVYHFYSGFQFSFDTWSKGSRIKESGNTVVWVETAQPDDSPETFSNFMLRLHMYANPLSLSSDVSKKNVPETGYMLTRDREDKKGYDTALMIVDKAMDLSGRTALLLAGCGTPGQEGYILDNAFDPANAPWFIIPESGLIETSEGIFSVKETAVFKGTE